MNLFLITLLALLLLVGTIATVPAWRRLLCTQWLFKWFQRRLPPMSATEREAIYAGDTWYETELFQGKPDWSQLLANPMPKLSEREQVFLNNEVEQLCAMVDEWQVLRNLDLPPAVWQFIKQAGFFGLHIPKEYGGLGFSALASSTIVQKIATKSLTAAVTVMVPNSLGPAELLLKYGTDAQRKQYLHNLARGVEVPCFGLTAPDAGSDASAITDSGIITRGNFGGQQNVLGLKLNWDKRYITLAPVATLIGLAVKVYDPDHLLGDQPELGITVVLVPRDLPGIEIGHRHFPLNQAFMNGPIRGKDVFVPLDAIIGGKERIGRGWQMLVECLAAGRGISLPALSTATGKHCFRTTGAYAKLRRQFNLPIGKFEGVSTALARIGGFTYLLEATRLLTLTAIDQGHKPAVVTAICKYHMTEMGRHVVNDAMDIHAGRAIQLGPRNYLANYYIGTPVSITVEGANILTRCLMIFGQGAIRCHPYILAEMEAGATQNLLAFDQAITKHISYFVQNFAKLKWHALTGTLLCSKPAHTRWGYYYRQLSFLSLGLACSADLAMLILGGNLKRKENLSARLGDVLSYLYMASAVLKYHQDHKENSEDVPYVEWALQHCLQQIQHAFLYLSVNFPQRWLGACLRWLIIPPWRNYRMPSDQLHLEISSDMMQDSALRARLTNYCLDDKIEEVWRAGLAVEPLLVKIDHAVKQKMLPKQANYAAQLRAAFEQKLLTAAELKQLQDFEDMRLQAMRVDEFTNAELMGK